MSEPQGQIEKRIDELVGLLIEDHLDESSLAELESLVLAEPMARRRYVRLMEAHTALSRYWQGQEKVATSLQAKLPSIDAHPRARRYRLSMESRHLAVGVAIALAFVVMSIGVMHQIILPGRVAEKPSPEDAPKEADRNIESIARIVRDVDAQWVGAVENPVAIKTEKIKTGMSLYPGQRLTLASGLAEFKFFNGAEVILEGPAEFEVVSREEGRLYVGKATTLCPVERAEGFVLDTPKTRFEDLGTEFGVVVLSSGATQLHVFDGEVRAKPNVENANYVSADATANESLAFSPDGNLAERGSSSGQRFVRSDALAARIIEDRFDHWLEHRKKLSEDPAVVAHYSFEESNVGNDKLRNVASRGGAPDGVVYGAEWTKGRWDHKAALRFGGKASGHRVELNTAENDPFEFESSFSVAVWFQVESWNAGHQAILVRDEDTWRVQRYGSDAFLTFDTGGRESMDRLSGQKTVDDRRWHHVAAVFDRSGAGTVKSLYVDGRLEATVEMEEHNIRSIKKHPLTIASNPAQPDREFHGKIDEVIILSRVLSDREIREMYKAGKP